MVVRAKLHNITQNAKNNCYKYLNRNQILYHKKNSTKSLLWQKNAINGTFVTQKVLTFSQDSACNKTLSRTVRRHTTLLRQETWCKSRWDGGPIMWFLLYDYTKTPSQSPIAPLNVTFFSTFRGVILVFCVGFCCKWH